MKTYTVIIENKIDGLRVKLHGLKAENKEGAKLGASVRMRDVGHWMTIDVLREPRPAHTVPLGMGTPYYVPDVNAPENLSALTWGGDAFDLLHLKAGLCFARAKDARRATRILLS